MSTALHSIFKYSPFTSTTHFGRNDTRL